MQQKSTHSLNDVISTSYEWGSIANKEKSRLQEINPLISGLHDLENDDETDADIEINKIGGSMNGSVGGGMSNITLPSLHSKGESHHSSKKEQNDDDVINSLIGDGAPSKHSIKEPSRHDSPKRDSHRRDSPKRDSPRRDSPRHKSPRHKSPRRSDSPKRKSKHESESSSDHRKKSRDDDPSKWSREELNLKKLEIFALLEELKSYGVTLSNDYTFDSDYSMMKREYDFHRTLRDKRGAVDLYEKGFTSGVIAVELANESKYNPFKLKLKGYSHQVRSEMDTYREIFADFYEKYKEKNGKISPETRFFFTFVGGAVMFHMSKCNEEQEQLDNDRIERVANEAVNKRIDEVLKARGLMQQPQPQPAFRPPPTTTMPVRSQIILPPPVRSITPVPYSQPTYQPVPPPQYYPQQPLQYQPMPYSNPMGGQIPIFAQPAQPKPSQEEDRDSLEDKLTKRRISTPSPKQSGSKKTSKKKSTTSSSKRRKELFVDTEHL